MTFASRMQHKIYWGPLKKPLEWSLKTWLAPWAYIASVLYHDSFWYPTHQEPRPRDPAQRLGPAVPQLGREALPPDDLTTPGWADPGADPAELRPEGLRLFRQSLGILGTCMREAPEFSAQRRHVGR